MSYYTQCQFDIEPFSLHSQDGAANLGASATIRARIQHLVGHRTGRRIRLVTTFSGHRILVLFLIYVTASEFSHLWWICFAKSFTFFIREGGMRRA